MVGVVSRTPDEVPDPGRGSSEVTPVRFQWLEVALGEYILLQAVPVPGDVPEDYRYGEWDGPSKGNHGDMVSRETRTGPRGIIVRLIGVGTAPVPCGRLRGV